MPARSASTTRLATPSACSTSAIWVRCRCVARRRAVRQLRAHQRPGRIRPGKAQYTLCCNESGGVIDDLIAYYISDDEIFLVPNAANTGAVVTVLQAAAPGGVRITNEHRCYAVLAVQGPRSSDVLEELGLPTRMDYMAYADASFSGVPVRVCRSGYTGEHGYELMPPWESAGCCSMHCSRPSPPRAGSQPAGRPRHTAHRDGLPAARP
ncbi:aminomethyltransferase folate-binding domain protein [Mycobacterium xenopi 3993]|nr:aminomethyltransferase folate-binding domain protein [Mycobacterium xenopi 3993]